MTAESTPVMAKNHVAKFAASTSGHGYKNVVEARTIARSLLWALLLAGAICGLGYHLSLISASYFAYEKRVGTNNVLEPLHFPKVTICPTAYYSNYLMSQSYNSKLLQMHTQIFDLTAPYFGSADEDNREAVVDKALLDAYLESRLPEVANVTVAIDAILLTCSFGWRNCTAANFTPVASDRYGICYLFTPDAAMASVYGGYDNGLTLSLAYEGLKDNYFSTAMRYTRGYVVLITPFDKFINFFRSTPVGAPAGHRTDIGMLPERTKRMPTSNDPCTRRHQAVNYDGNALRYDYDTVNCVDMTLNEVVNTACSCVTDQLPIPPALQSRPRCSRLSFIRQTNGSLMVSNITRLMLDRQCVENQLRKNDDLSAYGRLVSGCQKACVEESIVSHAAVAVLPVGTKWTGDYFRLLTETSSKITSGRSFLPALLGIINSTTARDHVSQVSVFFTSPTLTVFEEDWQYPIESFLSEGGGVIGLWAGASVLTMLEFLDLFFGLVGVLVWPRRGGTQTAVVAVSQPTLNSSDAELVESNGCKTTI